ncbi:MAG: hypothetical protein ACYCXX_13575 [Acidiferrobacter thiooxydans]
MTNVQVSIPMSETASHLLHLAPFMGRAQTQVLWDLCRQGEERAFFRDLVMQWSQRIAGMPKTYEQDGKGAQAVAYLHYFLNGWDWYIVEKDVSGGGLQVFGLTAGPEHEMGYISLPEITGAGAELDLYWTPKTLVEIKEAASA